MLIEHISKEYEALRSDIQEGGYDHTDEENEDYDPSDDTASD